MIKHLGEKLGNLAGNALTWAFAGVIFGGAFAALYEFWSALQIHHLVALIGATVLAGTFTAGFFGSLVVALAGTLTGIVVAISYQILLSSYQMAELLILIAFVLGLIAGTFFSKRELSEYQPLGQAGSGLIAGLFSGLTLSAISVFTPISTGSWISAAIAVSVVGLSYVFLAHHIPRAMQRGPLLQIGGALVCGIISMGVAFAFWLIGESMDLYWQTEAVSRFANVLDNVPIGAMGGAFGGAIGGIGLELLGIKIERHAYVS
ncbi:MAG: hypothetical protein ACWA5Q_02505 [bacterium]